MGKAKETEEVEKKPVAGCSFRSLYSALFRRWGGQSLPRESPASSTPNCGSSAELKRRRSVSEQASLSVSAKGSVTSPPREKSFLSPNWPVTSPPREKSFLSPNWPVTSPSREKSLLSPNSQTPQQQKGVRRTSESPVRAAPQQSRVVTQPMSISVELDSVLYDHQRTKGSSNLVRASSGNVMLFGNLGTLRSGNPGTAPSRNVLDYLPKTATETEPNGRTKQSSRVGPVHAVMDKSDNEKKPAPAPAPVTCRALSKRMTPEELKTMGDMECSKGRFAEALVLYDQVIAMDPGRALYWNDKAAALTGLGLFLEAVAECREAVKIEPGYCKAHHRLATLYLRLGEADKAIHHYKQAEGEVSSKDMARAMSLQIHLTKCNEAHKRKDWQNVLNEAQSALSAGANSAPQVFASQAEALLKLRMHEDAESTLIDAPTFDVEASTKFFGVASSAYILVVRALVDMAFGRFDNSVSRAQRAARIDPSNREIATMVRRTRTVSLARSKGNDLYKASKFEEACVAYGEGLDHDPHNSILLCNRAACRSKLGQWEKSVEDCNMALNVRPSYKKARLRRADSYAKLKMWEESVQDYEVLIQEMPGDEEVLRALVEVRGHLTEGDKESKDQNLSADHIHE